MTLENKTLTTEIPYQFTPNTTLLRNITSGSGYRSIIAVIQNIQNIEQHASGAHPEGCDVCWVTVQDKTHSIDICLWEGFVTCFNLAVGDCICCLDLGYKATNSNIYLASTNNCNIIKTDLPAALRAY